MFGLLSTIAKTLVILTYSERSVSLWEWPGYRDVTIYVGAKVFFFNPLPPEFFSSFFGTHPKIGPIRLPTHSRDAHRNFF